jgi:6,7-dimethyl-8-ribityllumazine synthase
MPESPFLLIVEARFYEDIADALVSGAVAAIEAAGGTYQRVTVPGAFEIPAALRMAIRSMDLPGGRRRFDGFVALGCVIRGETTHYDHICNECMGGIAELALTYSVAIGNGVLTCENRDQAWERAAVDRKDKGGDAARAVLRMIEVKRQFLPER